MMQKWQFMVYYWTDGVFTLDGSRFWTVKDKQGKSGFEKVAELTAEGWEPVGTVALTNSGTTLGVLFSFKRLFEEAAPQQQDKST